MAEPLRSAAAVAEAACQALQRLDVLGLNRGSTGNLSWRDAATAGGAAMWITPTGMGAADIGVDDFVQVAIEPAPDGPTPGVLQGRWQPSSEWHFHRAIYRARPDLNAVVHVHSVHATALACLRRELPPFHYMVAVAGGDSVPCVPYHLFGTEALSQAVAAALVDRNACLLANHGLVAAGATLAQAMKITLEIESLCEVYLKALAVGEPVRLDAGQMRAVIERFRSYGQRAAASRS
jgi:L-fuculose-phosphate aldolase